MISIPKHKYSKSCPHSSTQYSAYYKIALYFVLKSNKLWLLLFIFWFNSARLLSLHSAGSFKPFVWEPIVSMGSINNSSEISMLSFEHPLESKTFSHDTLILGIHTSRTEQCEGSRLSLITLQADGGRRVLNCMRMILIPLAILTSALNEILWSSPFACQAE